MSREPTSRTRKEVWVEESLFGLPGHYVTKITDGEHTVEGRGRDAKESQKVASDKWDKKKTK